MTNQAVGPMVRDAVARAGIVDMHTHLYHEGFGSLLLWGIDELVTYHYLVAEFHRVRPDVPPAAFARLPKREQADRIWSELFIKRSPVSEAGRGVVTTLERLGLDPAERDLDRARAHFRTVKLSRHIDRVFEAAGLEYVVMTNDPFDAQEAVCWKRGKRRDERFKAALRIDGLLMGWKTVLPDLRAQGYDVDKALTKKTLAAMGQFLEDWFEIMDPLYLAASLPPEIAYPAFDDFTVLLDEVVLPLCRRKRVPFAAMIGVRKLTNPELGVAGDTVGAMDIRVVEALAARNPENRFLVTLLSRENQHELCIAARKFPNLMVFGCWWYLNDPSIIREMTAERLELLGLSFVPQHSDARILDQLVYKWAHSRETIGMVLAEKYEDLARAGWRVSRAEIDRDVARLFRGNFEEFCGIGKRR